jgi:hypothetical protein
MSTTEKRIQLVVGTLLCSFFFGLGEQRAPAVILNCPQCSCVDTYAWWVGIGTQSLSAQVVASPVPPGPGSMNTSNAIINCWNGACTRTTPLVAAGNYDRYIWTTNTATCKTPAGLYPAPQPVTPGGTPTYDSTPVRNTCS